jgi:SAM-dependent methyltransferase
LDALVAEQKRREHLKLLHDWSDGRPRTILKTDLFEEANGADELVSAFPAASVVVGMDISPATVARARARGLRPAHFLATDARRLGLASGCVDVVFSNSTLDHFESLTELETALRELARVLRPGGRLIVTLDNRSNPLYGLLRWTSRRGWAPFSLGHTASLAELVSLTRQAGLEVIATRTLIHNPRLLSTGLFVALRWGLGGLADRPIQGLLGLFARLGHLPTRDYTACFVAVCGRKPLNG